MATSPKSDVAAKEAFRSELLRRGYDSVEITGRPADITARKGETIHYFEIKYTNKSNRYFGAATLTEWEAALAHEDRFTFVVAMRRKETWAFHEYTPSEFMSFSSIPPFKIFFNVAVLLDKDIDVPEMPRTARLTRERIVQMCELFRSFKTR